MNPVYLFPNPAVPRILAVASISDSAVREPGAQYDTRAAHRERLAAAARQWHAHARYLGGLREDALLRKAFSALAFSLSRRVRDFAVPTKLVGTSRCQNALRALRDAPLGMRLDVRVVTPPTGPFCIEVTTPMGHSGDGATSHHAAHRLGLIQRKHASWLAPLLGYGASVHLLAVSGQRERWHTLGCNVALGGLGAALRAFGAAPGSDAEFATHRGDGATSAFSGTPAMACQIPGIVQVRPHRQPEHDGSRDPGRDDEIVLARDPDGNALAHIGARALTHTQRHSPTGIEWGYAGSGPADLALSILTEVCGDAVASALYQFLKVSLVASIPHEGGIVRAGEVRAWARARSLNAA